MSSDCEIWSLITVDRVAFLTFKMLCTIFRDN